jgi:Uncharacterised nucleotidyltransferase
MPWRIESRFSADPAHKLLIEAAIDKGAQGRRSFEAWKKRVQLTDIDYPSQKMLSAVSHHVTDDDVSQQVVRVAKFTWLRSQTLLRAGLRAEQALREGGIPVAWIKGAAVLARTTTKVSERPMEDIDLLIPLDYLPQAALCLNAAGFHSSADQELVNCPEKITHNSHAIAFKDSAGAEVDVHWQVLKGTRKPAVEEGVWSRTSQAKILDQDTRVICPEDLLLHVIATNREGNDAYWVLDAIRIIEDNPLDFRLFLELARERGLGRSSLIALAIINGFKPRVIPRRYLLVSEVIRLADAIGDVLIRNTLVSNMKELGRLPVPRSINTEYPTVAFSGSNFSMNYPVIESPEGGYSFSFGFENPRWFRHPAATWNWHQTEPAGMWTSARLAHVELALPGHLSAATVKVSYNVISSRFARVRSIGIYADGKLAHKRVLCNPFGVPQESEFHVTRRYPSEPLRVSFRVSSVIIPRRHGINLDQRPLGLFLQELHVQETT